MTRKLYIKNYGQTEEPTGKTKSICPFNVFEVGGIKKEILHVLVGEGP